MLAENPGVGRFCNEMSPGLHRHEHGRRVIFYRENPGGIRIIRDLHQQMVPDKSRLES